MQSNTQTAVPLTLDNAAITKAVVAQLIDNFMRTDDSLYEEVERRIGKKIDALFLAKVQPRIDAELDKALGNVFDREYQKRTASILGIGALTPAPTSYWPTQAFARS